MESRGYLWEQLIVADTLEKINFTECPTTHCSIAATPASNHTAGRDVVKRYKSFKIQEAACIQQ